MAEVEPVRDMEDVRRMYKWLNEHSTAREAECFLIGCNLALRAGDLLSLPFSKIDGKTHIELNEQKTGKHKRIPITPFVREAVERLKAFYASRNFNATYRWPWQVHEQANGHQVPVLRVQTRIQGTGVSV